MSRDLHTYQCGNCKTLATTTVRLSPLRCQVCRSFMTYGWSAPIVSDEDRARAAKGIVFSPGRMPLEPIPSIQRCGRRGCGQYRPPAALLNGRFCSEACGAKDSEDVAAQLERIEQLYQLNPWLRPREKETA